jgi:hypothetical protein
MVSPAAATPSRVGPRQPGQSAAEASAAITAVSMLKTANQEAHGWREAVMR